MNNSEDKKTYYLNAYDDTNKLFGDGEDFNFMNHGYHPVHPKCIHLFLDTCASMYCSLADRLGDVNNKNILDVGCGRGGGTKLLKKFYNFSEVCGCDLNKKNIDQCQKDPAGCSFKIDDAEYLGKYRNEYFDFIINIESSHCYSNLNKFFEAIKRILKKHGIFITADIIRSRDIPIYLSAVSKSFEIQRIENITSNVENSCRHLLEKLSKSDLNDERNIYWKELVLEKLEFYSNKDHHFLASILKKYK